MTAEDSRIARTADDVRRLTPAPGHYWVRYVGRPARPADVDSPEDEWSVVDLSIDEDGERSWDCGGETSDDDAGLVNYAIDGPIARPAPVVLPIVPPLTYECSDDERAFIVKAWRAMFTAAPMSFPYFPLTEWLTRERIADMEERGLVNVMSYMAGEAGGPPTHVHIEPTWGMADHLRKQGATVP